MTCFVIAEAGVNHNGDEALALAMVKAAKQAGADAVKFQTFSAAKLAHRDAPKAGYQKETTGDGNQLAMLTALELSASAHAQLYAECRKLDIEFMSTPFDDESAQMLVALGMRRIKIPSGELTNLPFIEYVANFGKPLIMSTGMATLEEVEEAVEVVNEVRRQRQFPGTLGTQLTLLHCTSNYPAAAADVNLRAMVTLAKRFHVPVGYSDHTLSGAIPVAAVAMGASVIEKHFTMDRTLPGPDQRASLEPAALAALINDIRAVETAFGDGRKEPRSSEIPIREVVRRSVTLARDVARGETITKDAVLLLRPGNGIAPKQLKQVVGRRARRALAAGTLLAWDDLE